MQLIRRLFQKFRGCLIRRTFTGWFKDSGIDKIRKDRIDIIFESIFIPELPTSFIKVKTIVKSLRKKISSTEESLLTVIQLLIGMKCYLYRLSLLFFFIFKSFQSGFFFRPIHDIITCGTVFDQKFLKRSEFTYIDRCTFTLIVNKTFGDIKRFRILRFRCSYFHDGTLLDLLYHTLVQNAI